MPFLVSPYLIDDLYNYLFMLFTMKRKPSRIKKIIVKRINFPWKIFVLYVALFLVSCSGPGEYRAGQQSATILQIDEFFLSEQFKETTPHRIAILPFENLTDDKAAAGLVRRCFYNHFSAKKYHDVELYRINMVLTRDGLLSGHKYKDINPSRLGQILQADGLIYGKVTSFNRVFLGAVSQVSVELDVQMVDARTGNMCWRAKHCTYHRAGGVSLNPVMIIPAIVRAALNVRDIEMLRTSEDLSRKILKTLPEPSLSEMQRPPNITFFAHDAKKDWKTTGDVIHVAMVGQSGMMGSFAIANIRDEVALVEDNPGVYSGTYTVMPGDNVTNGLVTGHLIDEKGNKSEWVDPLQLVNIDTNPPSQPEKATTYGRNRKIVIKWNENDDNTVLEYVIFRSLKPKNEYREIARTQLLEHIDSSLNNETPYYYKIAAVDRAGNMSKMSEYCSCIPVKPGPTSVSGSINMDTTWYAGSSPIVLENDVCVMNGATLLIEPGTLIVSNGPGLKVAGRLCAQGKETDPIRFSFENIADKDGVWAGIVFDNTNDSDSIMEHCKIKNSSTAITILSSSPKIRRCTLMNNSKGLDIQELSKPIVSENTIINNVIGIECNKSTPVIMNNTISKNTSGGILAIDAFPEIRENNICANGEYNLFFHGASNAELNVPDNWWGSSNLSSILSSVRGFARITTILSAPVPDGVRIGVRSLAGDEETDAAMVTNSSLECIDGDTDFFSVRMINNARKQLRDGKNDDAIKLLACAVAVDPGVAEAQYMLGMMYSRIGDHTSSVPRFISAVRLVPNNLIYHYTLGLAYRESGNYTNAVAEWKRVLEIDPTHAGAQTLINLYSDKDK